MIPTSLELANSIPKVRVNILLNTYSSVLPGLQWESVQKISKMASD